MRSTFLFVYLNCCSASIPYTSFFDLGFEFAEILVIDNLLPALLCSYYEKDILKFAHPLQFLGRL
jgi:hypothetical protein